MFCEVEIHLKASHSKNPWMKMSVNTEIRRTGLHWRHDKSNEPGSEGIVQWNKAGSGKNDAWHGIKHEVQTWWAAHHFVVFLTVRKRGALLVALFMKRIRWTFHLYADRWSSEIKMNKVYFRYHTQYSCPCPRHERQPNWVNVGKAALHSNHMKFV
jgi:hypothetical protein